MRVALFDFDGTLVNSGPTVIGAARATLEARGYPVPDAVAIRGFVGPPLLNGITQVLGVPAEEAASFRDAYREIYTQTMTQAEVYPGVEDALRSLLDDGWTLAVATSKREDLARRIAEAKGLDRYFTVIAGADLAEQHDKAWVIGQALDRLEAAGVDASQAIMIGDRHHDVDGAAARGLRCVFVTWGYGPESEGAPASAIARDPSACVDALRQLASTDALPQDAKQHS